MNNDPTIGNQPNGNYEPWKKMVDDFRRGDTPTEQQHANNEILDGIEQLDPNDKKFMTAIVGSLHNKTFGYNEQEYKDTLLPIAMKYVKYDTENIPGLNGINDCGTYLKARANLFLLEEPQFKKIIADGHWVLSTAIERTFEDIEIGRQIQNATDSEGYDSTIEQFYAEYSHEGFSPKFRKFNEKIRDEDCMGLLGENTQISIEREKSDKGIIELIAKDVMDDYLRGPHSEERQIECENYLDILNYLYDGEGLGRQAKTVFKNLYSGIESDMNHEWDCKQIAHIKTISRMYHSYKASYESFRQNSQLGNSILNQKSGQETK